MMYRIELNFEKYSDPNIFRIGDFNLVDVGINEIDGCSPASLFCVHIFYKTLNSYFDTVVPNKVSKYIPISYLNSNVWAHENPREIQSRWFKNGFFVNVWLGHIDDNVCSFLITIHDYIKDIPLNFKHDSWIQLDWSPSDFEITVREWLNTNYP